MRHFHVNFKYGSTIYTSIKHTCLQIRIYNSIFFALGLKALCTQPCKCVALKGGARGKASELMLELTVSNLGEDFGYSD